MKNGSYVSFSEKWKKLNEEWRIRITLSDLRILIESFSGSKSNSYSSFFILYSSFNNFFIPYYEYPRVESCRL